MRARLVIGLFGLALPVALAVACRAPTQARVDIVTTAPCAELTGVALTVKSRPVAAEQAVAGRFVTATTRECASGRVGDIVLAPGEDTGAIVVVAGYKGVPATDCVPPAYANCIVARRSFSFIEHTTLTIPISLDPDCVNVPCDALSTCSKGKCVDATVRC
ncbi:MAG: hypothetical protein JNL38_39170, partial [Myxococcales bacterium]|nr:hypothetical protein [Myxococcales bacterium]